MHPILSQGDSIQLECFYRTASITDVTVVSLVVVHSKETSLLYAHNSMQGGESTREEMCLTFLLYYPQVDLSLCISRPPFQSSRFEIYVPFAQEHIE